MATPFVQGRLSGKAVAATISTQCAQSGRELRIHLDRDLGHRVEQDGARPLIFTPLKVVQPGAPSIIDGF